LGNNAASNIEKARFCTNLLLLKTVLNNSGSGTGTGTGTGTGDGTGSKTFPK
jgi:hypothetical protein